MNDDAGEASAMPQTYEDRLQLAKVDAVALPVDLPNFTLIVRLEPFAELCVSLGRLA